jgi:2,4-dienoyl-CoA reductase-like NADH-dependent reductase (Old Yellow Enzyme family)
LVKDILIDIFANLERGATKLAVAGKLYSAADCQRAVDAGADIVAIGRAAVTNHDFPRLAKDSTFAMMMQSSSYGPIAMQTL